MPASPSPQTVKSTVPTAPEPCSNAEGVGAQGKPKSTRPEQSSTGKALRTSEQGSTRKVSEATHSCAGGTDGEPTVRGGVDGAPGQDAPVDSSTTQGERASNKAQHKADPCITDEGKASQCKVVDTPREVPTAKQAQKDYEAFMAKVHIFKVLYLFAGRRARGGIRAHLEKAIKKFCERSQMKCKLELHEVDIAIGGEGHNLHKPEIQVKWLCWMEDEVPDLTVTTPPCAPWTRAQHSLRPGPKAVRSKRYPLGLPYMTEEDEQRCDVGTSLASFAFEALYTTTLLTPKEGWRRCKGLMEHPEDLGQADKDIPASVWQMREPMALTVFADYQRGAINQCELQTAPYDTEAPRKPTGILTNIKEILAWTTKGWPQFKNGYYKGKRTAALYDGPIRPAWETYPHAWKACRCKWEHKPMTGRKANGDFSTAGSAEWPAGMCRTFSQEAVQDWGGRLKAYAGLLREGKAASCQPKRSARQPNEGLIEALWQRPSLCGNATVPHEWEDP